MLSQAISHDNRDKKLTSRISEQSESRPSDGNMTNPANNSIQAIPEVDASFEYKKILTKDPAKIIKTPPILRNVFDLFEYLVLEIVLELLIFHDIIQMK